MKNKTTNEKKDELTKKDEIGEENRIVNEDDKEQQIQENNDNETIFKEDSEDILLLKKKIDNLQDKLLRSMAESENIRLRSEKKLEEAKQYSITNFAKALVPVADNLARAIEHMPSKLTDEQKALIQGIEMTKKELNDVFNKNGLELIKPEAGDKFDYNLHNAISQIETKDFSSGTIVSTMQVGYKIFDRLLRPAAVVVAK